VKSQRRGTALTIAAIVSTIAAMVLCLGYVGRFGPSLCVGAAAKRDRHEYSLWLESGCISFWSQSYHFATVPPKPLPMGTTISWLGEWHRPYLSDLIRTPHSDGTTLPYGWGSTVISITDLPIWCALLPCLIAPLLWWRRRNRREIKGFEVISSEN
jgi:hypothetical protein